MRDPSPVSQHGIILRDRPSQGSVQYDSVSSIHSDHPHVAKDPPEIAHMKRGYGVIRSRPADLDLLQNLPLDWEDREHSTRHHPDEPNAGPGALPRSWQPLWLRRSTLLSMSGSFIVLAALVLGLHFMSVNNKGLGSTSSSNSAVYVWKYLPTTGRFESHYTTFICLVGVRGSNVIPNFSDCHSLGCMEWYRLFHPIAPTLGQSPARTYVSGEHFALGFADSDCTGHDMDGSQDQGLAFSPDHRIRTYAEHHCEPRCQFPNRCGLFSSDRQ